MQLGKTRSAALATAMALGLFAESSAAVTIDVQSVDDPDVGFNDPTSTAPVGDNTETTRGAQALAAFRFAANIWGAALDSPVTIRVAARFGPLECNAANGVVGSGTPHSFVKDQAGGQPGVWYPIALADRLAGKDLDETAPAIDLVFNGAAGSKDCLEASGWYLGLDGNSGNLTDLVTAVVHELGHGLGMTTPVELQTGAFRDGLPDVFSLHAMDERTGKHWSDLTDAARAVSARDYQQLSWDGPAVTAAAASLLTKGMPVLALGPAPLDTVNPAIAVATFGPALGEIPVLGPIAAVADDMTPPTDACGTSASLTGKVAFIEAGGCTDVEKVLSVQTAGAIAAILVSAQNTLVPLPPNGDGSQVTIPSVRINQKDAQTIRAALPQAASARLWANPMRGLGTSVAGRVYLDAIDPVVDHVSVVHWDTTVSPHLLMQPTLETTHELDLTLPFMQDLGWKPIRCGDGVVDSAEECDDGPDAGKSKTCSADCKLLSGRDSGTPTTDGGDGLFDASTDARLGTQSDAAPGPNRFLDGGSSANVGPAGIVWVPRGKGCSCRVGARTGSWPGPALLGVVLGALVLARRRRGEQ
jgi:MYXO-CTERM domain-containing protein